MENLNEFFNAKVRGISDLSLFLNEQQDKLNSCIPQKKQGLLHILLDLCKNENWKHYIFDRDKMEVNFFKQNIRFGFCIDRKCYALDIDSVFFHDIEVDLTCQQLEEIGVFLSTNFKTEVERMIDGENEEEALREQRDLEAHLNHHRL